MAPQKEQDNFVKLCGDGDLESVEYLLEDNPNLVNSSNYGMINYILSH